MSEYLEEVEEESISLVAQLGSGSKYLLKGKTDVRITTVLRSSEDNPDTLKSALYWLTYDDVVNKNIDFASSVIDNLLHLNIGINGRGRRDILRGEQVMKGGAVTVESEIKSPGWTDRLLRRDKVRQWEEQQREQLEI